MLEDLEDEVRAASSRALACRSSGGKRAAAEASTAEAACEERPSAGAAEYAGDRSVASARGRRLSHERELGREDWRWRGWARRERQPGQAAAVLAGVKRQRHNHAAGGDVVEARDDGRQAARINSREAAQAGRASEKPSDDAAPQLGAWAVLRRARFLARRRRVATAARGGRARLASLLHATTSTAPRAARPAGRKATRARAATRRRRRSEPPAAPRSARAQSPRAARATRASRASVAGASRRTAARLEQATHETAAVGTRPRVSWLGARSRGGLGLALTQPGSQSRRACPSPQVTRVRGPTSSSTSRRGRGS